MMIYETPPSIAVVSKQMHSSLFADPGTLQQIVEKIVVPNLRLREMDEELFEDNPADYIQRDMEGEVNCWKKALVKPILSDSPVQQRCIALAVHLVGGWHDQPPACA